MTTRLFHVLLVAILGSGCKKSEDAGELLSAGDLAQMRLEPDGIDPASTHVIGLAGVLPATTAVHVRDISVGAKADGTTIENGSFDILVAGGHSEDIFGISAGEDEDSLTVARAEDGSVVQAWGEGWSSEVGCILDGWTGIISQTGGDPLDQCFLGGQIVEGGAQVSGDVGPFVIGRDSVLRSRIGVVANGSGVVPDIEVVFIDDVLDTEFTVHWTPSVSGVETHTLVLGDETDGSPDLVGKTIGALRISSSGDSSLGVSDLAVLDVESPVPATF